VTDFLRHEARRELSARAGEKAQRIARRPGRISIRDTQSRWGSCSSDGDISFSWRLILAPEPVLDYVVAHEVSHLVHLDHGPRFWALVEKLAAEVAGPRRWLRRNGGALLRYG
jgi:predicted metal-dependent hydrolase